MMTAPEVERPGDRVTELFRTWARDSALGLSSLSPAMAAAATSVSPQLARAAQATENVWRQIGQEFGLLTSTEAAEHMGYGSNRTWASAQRKAGRLLGVRRGGAYRYPGFQLDAALVPSISELVGIARQHDWSDESVVLWLCSPSGWMPGGGRPVDSLHQEPRSVIDAARSAMAPRW
ncbi:hypothetical protein [Georgenia subflava]|uniref:DNA-binding protein n=1 Tax=Georgenia subflava TaxID=1622177 RepID=A0A6N7EGF4_9MICO|nr:hypothetical protein [Georgenia subflava]MPV35735.1 hypothetical protein [Georgenia subflava]